jgi:threonine/homoserine/homoserine lactone efflux protein
MPDDNDARLAQSARRASVVLAGSALFWILAITIGAEYALPNRVRALLDLIALAGFGLGLWLTYQVWRARQNGKR